VKVELNFAQLTIIDYSSYLLK